MLLLSYRSSFGEFFFQLLFKGGCERLELFLMLYLQTGDFWVVFLFCGHLFGFNGFEVIEFLISLPDKIVHFIAQSVVFFLQHNVLSLQISGLFFNRLDFILLLLNLEFLFRDLIVQTLFFLIKSVPDLRFSHLIFICLFFIFGS